MGSDFSKQLCCVVCRRCKKQEVEEANEDISETKPILQTSGDAPISRDTKTSTAALKVSKQVSKEVQSLGRVLGSSAATAEEDMETCSAEDAMGVTEGWVATWDSVDLVAPADGETQGQGKILTPVDTQQEREKVVNTEDKINPAPLASEAQPVPGMAGDVEPAAAPEQRDEQAEAGSEGCPCAGVTVQERNIPNFVEFPSESAAGQDSGESLMGGILLPCVVQMPGETETYLSAQHGEEMEWAKLGKISLWSAVGTELPALLTVQATQKAREPEDPVESMAHGMAETYLACAMPWESLCPEREALELTNQLLDFLEQELQYGMPSGQEMGSPGCAEPVELSQALCPRRDGVSGELEDEESGECETETAASEAEPQPKIMQQPEELPEAPPSCVQTPVHEDELLNVAPSLSEELGSRGEREAENAGAGES